MDILGIDLAKLTFDATVQTTSGAHHYQAFPNTPEGFTGPAPVPGRCGVRAALTSACAGPTKQ